MGINLLPTIRTSSVLVAQWNRTSHSINHNTSLIHLSFILFPPRLSVLISLIVPTPRKIASLSVVAHAPLSRYNTYSPITKLTHSRNHLIVHSVLYSPIDSLVWSQQQHAFCQSLSIEPPFRHTIRLPVRILSLNIFSSLKSLITQPSTLHHTIHTSRNETTQSNSHPA